MIPDNILSKLYCSFSLNTKHFLIDPKLLTCGHIVCKICILKEKFCKICNKQLKYDINNENSNEIEFIRRTFETYEEELKQLAVEQINDEVKHLVDDISKLDDQIDQRFSYVKEELEIRIESLKTELDQLHESLNCQIDSELLKIKSARKLEIEIEEDLCEYKNLESNDSMHDPNDGPFAINTHKLQRICQIREKVKDFNYQIAFEPSDRSIVSDIIGYIRVNRYVPWKRSSNHSIIHLNSTPLCLFTRNTNELMISTTSQQIQIYDKDFNRIRIIEKINNKAIFPFSIAINNRNQLYICDARNSKLIMTDMDFKYLNEYGKRGAAKTQLNNPYDLAIYQSSIYVCDHMNKRIQKLSIDFIYENTIYLMTTQ